MNKYRFFTNSRGYLFSSLDRIKPGNYILDLDFDNDNDPVPPADIIHHRIPVFHDE